MQNTPSRFPRNDIISLTGPAPRYDLAESIGPDMLLPDLLADAGQSVLSNLALSYGSVAGEPLLRKLVAKNNRVEPDEVILTMGGMHALFLTGFILGQSGAEFVLPMPSFPNTGAALSSTGATIKTVQSGFDARYRIDPVSIGAALSARTRLVCLESPRNPSGVAVDAEFLQAILAEMDRKCPDAFLLVDETYRQAVYGSSITAESAATIDSRIISTASLSKCHGSPGLRIGWAITRNEAFREQLLLGKFNTVISCSPVDEALAIAVLEQQETIVGERRGLLENGLMRIAAWVDNNAELVEWVRPDAGALCCIRLKHSAFDEAAVEQFHQALAARGIRVARGSWFGDETNVFRLGFGLLPMAQFDQALAGLTEALHEAVRQAA
ncbi:MAG: pyridoxal phosphate-dependent aminotransferase [Stappiaceae bacterium]